jgi:16S rRNA (cytosine967-C5)-methyltransferase
VSEERSNSQRRLRPRPGSRPRRAPRADASRLVAYDVLRAVADRDAYANLVLPSLLSDRGIEGRDAAFATELVYGTLRMRGLYDAVLATCVDRPLDALDDGIIEVLRLGAHQLLGMRVPTHAAVSETVDVARTVMSAGPSALINAVLRTVSRQDAATWIEQVAPSREADLLGHLSIEHSHPRWIVSAFHDALAGDVVALEALLVANNEAPMVTLVARPGRMDRDALIERGAEPGRWSPLSAVLPSGDPAALDVIRDGRAGVQDEGSQLVALALANAPVVGDEGAWLDLCAGPGGKAALLAGLADEAGGSLTAVEPREHRARLVEQALLTAPGEHLVLTGDGTVIVGGSDVSVASYDRVLVDAPCSGLGALRRRPESRWRRQPSDVAALVPLQRSLLGAALDAVKPGGVVAYVTCSPHLAETRMVVADVMRKRADVEQLDARPLFPGVSDLGEGPHVQLWPHLHGTDAMFLALLRRAPSNDGGFAPSPVG